MCDIKHLEKLPLGLTQTAPLNVPVALKNFTGSAEFDLRFTGNPILVTGRAFGGCTSSTGRAEELPVPYQILREDDISTQFSLEYLSLFGQKAWYRLAPREDQQGVYVIFLPQDNEIKDPLLPSISPARVLSHEKELSSKGIFHLDTRSTKLTLR